MLILSADFQAVQVFRHIIEAGPYQVAVCDNLTEVKSLLAVPCLAVILDLDSTPLDNRTIRELKQSVPATPFLCASRNRFHPELQEAIRHHLFACLNKPVDPEELHYFLKCIRDNRSESRGPPGQDG